jgi:hypothetical protein
MELPKLNFDIFELELPELNFNYVICTSNISYWGEVELPKLKYAS